MSPGSWLTTKRIRIHGLLLAACLWTVYAVNMSTPGLLDRNGLVKGTDFLHFYTLGKLALQGRGDLLYDMRAQAELTRQLVAQAPDSLYVPLYGPQVSLLFAPFARMPYGWALTVWLAVNVLLYAFCCCAVWKTCPSLQKDRWTVLILAMAFPGFFHLLAWGQTSGLALLCFTLAYLALRSDRRLLAGLAIGALIFKPQLGLAAAVVFVIARQWKLDHRRRDRSMPRTGDGLAAIRHPCNDFVLACSGAGAGCDAAARTASIPDSFDAFLLVSIDTVAAHCVCSIRSQRSRRACARGTRVEEWGVAAGLLFGAAAGHGFGLTPLDRV